MLAVLDRVLEQIPDLLLDYMAWNDVKIDYEHPHVERLWRQIDDFRLSLHRIHPCKTGQALFHPHPWPSAMAIVRGEYEMAFGFGAGDEPPPIASRLYAKAGTRYAMIHPDAWHSVRPIHAPVWTVMVSGKPWQRRAPKSDRPLERLTPETRHYLFMTFHEIFPPVS